MKEYDRSERSPTFRGNGSVDPQNGDYQEQAAAGFVNWRLAVRGLVDNPLSLSLNDVRALPQRTQITRHDCVEGWSAIGEWTGPQLSALLEEAGLRNKQFIVFRCADNLNGDDYYESVDLDDAFSSADDRRAPTEWQSFADKNGAPLRMRIERQLGYKHPKYLTAIEAVASLENIGRGGRVIGKIVQDINGMPVFRTRGAGLIRRVQSQHHLPVLCNNLFEYGQVHIG